MRRDRERGLTLVELVISIVIISIAVIGILQVLSLTTRRGADPQMRKQALSIAEGLLEEVQLAHFTFCDPADATADTATGAVQGNGGCTSTIENAGPENGNIRPFDNVNDYVSAFGQPLRYTTSANGAPINVTGDFNATITITPAALNGIPADVPPYNNPAKQESLLITVNVTYNNGNDTIRLDGYRTRYAPGSLP